MQIIIVLAVIAVVVIIGFHIIAWLLGAALVLLLAVLFNPKVNAVLSLFYLLVRGAVAIRIGSVFQTVCVGLMAADCIRDIVKGHSYYRDFINGVDPLFVIKSLASIVTLGYARIFFLLFFPVIKLCLIRSVSTDVKRKVESGCLLPHSNYSSVKIKNDYYRKYITQLENDGAIISNESTVDREMGIRRKKLNNLYPKKFLEKWAETFAGDKALIDRREKAEQKLAGQGKYYAYLGASVYESYPRLITEAMSTKGRLSVSDLKNCEELKPLTAQGKNQKGTASDECIEYFIIQALWPLVANGTFLDDDLNDNDPLDTHVYQYTKSTKQMPSQSPETNPLLALDDD